MGMFQCLVPQISLIVSNFSLKNVIFLIDSFQDSNLRLLG